MKILFHLSVLLENNSLILIEHWLMNNKIIYVREMRLEIAISLHIHPI